MFGRRIVVTKSVIKIVISMSLLILLTKNGAARAATRSALAQKRKRSIPIMAAAAPAAAAALPNHHHQRRRRYARKSQQGPYEETSTSFQELQSQKEQKRKQEEEFLERQSIASTTATSAEDETEQFISSATRRKLGRQAQQATGDFMSAIGFVVSSTMALLFDRSQFQRLKPSVQALRNFLKTSGIDLELSQSLNVRLLQNIVILGRIQNVILQKGKDRRDLALLKKEVELPSNEEALRYMRYATAAYGNSMIRAAEMDVLGRFDNRLNRMTRERISDHVGVPEEDIVLLDVHYNGDGNHLRHFVAVDHEQRKIVLAIRGTFALSEIIVDVAGFSRHFCGGEAHSEMATMAERLWERCGETVLELLRANEGYDLVLTGHSLGAGTACLLNILCHRNGRELVEGRRVQCFAYSAPPVFTPLNFVPKAVQSCTNYIHDKDTVSFLSIDSVRHLFSSVRVIEKKHMGWLERMRCFAGALPVDPDLCDAVEQASHKRLKPKSGAPLLEIPAAANVWLRRKDGTDDTYDYKVCDSSKLAKLGILIDPNMLRDHFPSRYENAFHNLESSK